MDPGSFACLRLWYHQRDVDGNRRDAGIGKGFLIRSMAVVVLCFIRAFHRKLFGVVQLKFVLVKVGWVERFIMLGFAFSTILEII